MTANGDVGVLQGKPRMDEQTQTVKQQLEALVDKAHGGDTSVLPEIRTRLDAHPELWHYFCDLATVIERTWISFYGSEPRMQAAIAKRVEVLKQELAGPSPTDLERLLVERIAICWLDLQHADLVATGAAQQNRPRVAALAIKRQNGAQRRYLAAIRALATVRRIRAKSDSRLAKSAT